jgi:hypothetical protein
MDEAMSQSARSSLLAKQWVVDHGGAMSVSVEHGAGPRGIRKHWMQALEAVDPQAFENASQERFLTPETRSQGIVSHLYTAWCMAEGRCKTHSNDNMSIPMGNENMHWLMDLAIGQPHRWLTIQIDDTVGDDISVSLAQRSLKRTLLRRFHCISQFESDCYEDQKRAWA